MEKVAAQTEGAESSVTGCYQRDLQPAGLCGWIVLMGAGGAKSLSSLERQSDISTQKETESSASLSVHLPCYFQAGHLGRSVSLRG